MESAPTVLSVSARDAGCLPGIGAALAAAGPGATVSVRPGTYRERLIFTHDVTVVAEQGPGSVVIELAPGDDLVFAGGQVSLQGLRIVGGDRDLPAVEVAGGSVRLQDCEVRADAGSALHVRGGQLQMSAVAVSNSSGIGIIVESGAGEFRGCRFEQIASTAVVVAGASAPLLRDCVIGDAGGVGVLALGTSAGALERCRIHEVGTFGVLAQESSRLRLTDTVIEGGQVGLYVAEQARPQLRCCTLQGARRHAVVLLEQAAPTLTDCTIETAAGYGVYASGQAGGLVTGGRIRDTGAAGVALTGDATTRFSDVQMDEDR